MSSWISGKCRTTNCGHYSQLAAILGGRGVPSVDEAVKELYLQPLHHAFRQLVGAETLQFLMDARVLALPEEGESPWDDRPTAAPATNRAGCCEAAERSSGFCRRGGKAQTDALPTNNENDIMLRRLEALRLVEIDEQGIDAVAIPGDADETTGDTADEKPELDAEPDLDAIASEICQTLAAMLQLPVLSQRHSDAKSKAFHKAAVELATVLDDELQLWGAIFGWVFTSRLGQAVSTEEEAISLARSWMDDWLLGKQLAAGLMGSGLSDHEATQAVTLVKALIPNQDWYEASSKKQVTPELRTEKRTYRLLYTLLQDPDVQRAMGVNRYEASSGTTKSTSMCC